MAEADGAAVAKQSVEVQKATVSESSGVRSLEVLPIEVSVEMVESQGGRMVQ